MKTLLSELRSSVLVTVILAAVCCGLYPLVVFGLAQALFHEKANGSLVAFFWTVFNVVRVFCTTWGFCAQARQLASVQTRMTFFIVSPYRFAGCPGLPEAPPFGSRS